MPSWAIALPNRTISPIVVRSQERASHELVTCERDSLGVPSLHLPATHRTTLITTRGLDTRHRKPLGRLSRMEPGPGSMSGMPVNRL